MRAERSELDTRFENLRDRLKVIFTVDTELQCALFSGTMSLSANKAMQEILKEELEEMQEEAEKLSKDFDTRLSIAPEYGPPETPKDLVVAVCRCIAIALNPAKFPYDEIKELAEAVKEVEET